MEYAYIRFGRHKYHRQICNTNTLFLNKWLICCWKKKKKHWVYCYYVFNLSIDFNRLHCMSECVGFFYSCWDETYYHLSDSTLKLLILRLNYKFTIKIFWVACTHLLLIICDLWSYISWYGFVCIYAIYFDDEFWSLPRVVGSDHRLDFFFKSQCSTFISLLHSLVHEQRLIGFELWQILL